jgi:uncharacterized membrane protein YuzA (DUF378 family)
MKVINSIAAILVIIGGLNWGLVGLADYNLVESLFGMGGLTTVIYDLVGLSAILMIFSLSKMNRA